MKIRAKSEIKLQTYHMNLNLTFVRGMTLEAVIKSLQGYLPKTLRPLSELEKAEARIVEIEAQSDTLARCLEWLQNNVDFAYTVENIEQAMGVKNDEPIATQEGE